MKTIKPTYDKVVVRPVQPPAYSKGGITLPESAKERNYEATVVAINEESYTSLKVGDKIIYTKYAGQEVKVEGEEFPLLILKEEDILAVLT